jgi:site-specific DNA-methyltransferase (adenine-specific)
VHSRPGDLLLDFFAGSGTFGESAITLGRKCILVDNNPEALRVMEARFTGIDVDWVNWMPTIQHDALVQGRLFV